MDLPKLAARLAGQIYCQPKASALAVDYTSYNSTECGLKPKEGGIFPAVGRIYSNDRGIFLQIAAVRDTADASCAAPRLSLEEKAAIAERHAKKQADAQKRGISVMLRDIMAHKACFYPSFPHPNPSSPALSCKPFRLICTYLKQLLHQVSSSKRFTVYIRLPSIMV